MLLSNELPTGQAKIARQLCANFVKMHELCGAERSEDATPKRYISFLKTYQHVFQTKRDELMKKQGHLQVFDMLQFECTLFSFFYGKEVGD